MSGVPGMNSRSGKLGRKARRERVADGLIRKRKQTDIAAELGVSLNTVRRDIKQILLDLANDPVATQWRIVARAQLDKLINTWMDKALSGDSYATDKVLNIIDRQAKLFPPPQESQVELSGTVNTDSQARVTINWNDDYEDDDE